MAIAFALQEEEEALVLPLLLHVGCGRLPGVVKSAILTESEVALVSVLRAGHALEVEAKVASIPIRGMAMAGMMIRRLSVGEEAVRQDGVDRDHKF